MPHTHDFSADLAGTNIYSKVDLTKAYHQILVEPAVVPKTSITTPFGLFDYVRMPFSLRNSAQTFQRLINEVTRGLHFIFAYVYDILVASSSPEQHEQHLRLLFNPPQEYGLVINAKKRVLGVDALDFLGQRITSSGIRLLKEKARAIRVFPQPTSLRKLREFLGLVHFHRRLIPHCAEFLQPMTDLLKTKKATSSSLKRTDEVASAFSAVKETLVNTTLLVHLRTEAATRLTTDASSTAVVLYYSSFSRASGGH